MLKHFLLTVLIAATVVAVPGTAVAGLNAGWTWNDGNHCVYVQSNSGISGSNYFMSGTTQSQSQAGCSNSWGRNPGQIGIRNELWRSGVFCTQNTAWVSNTTITTFASRTNTWASRPCAAGAFTTRAHGRVQIPNGTWRPSPQGTPYMSSTPANW